MKTLLFLLLSNIESDTPLRWYALSDPLLSVRPSTYVVFWYGRMGNTLQFYFHARYFLFVSYSIVLVWPTTLSVESLTYN
jgi:hypothetical protein